MLARWQARAPFLPYALRFRIARWANLLALDSGAAPEVVTRLDGSQLALDLRDHIQWMTYYFGAHEPHLLPVVRALVRPGYSVVDLGAHIGTYALRFGRFYQSWADGAPWVLAAEPTPALFERLQQHLALNDLLRVVRAAPVAVSDNAGEALLYLSDYPNSANNALRDLRGSHPHTQDGRTVRVQRVRLDDLVVEVGLHRPAGLIKADIEGAELEAFRGAEALIQADRPFVLFEAHPVWMQRFGYTLSDMLAFWRERDYTCFVIHEGGTLRPLSLYRPPVASIECLAVPEEQRAALTQRGLKVRPQP